MGISVLTSMGFENRDFLKNTAKQILQKSGADEKAADSIVKNQITVEYGKTAEAKIYGMSAQITLNNSLKETLRYLQAHANDRRKKYVLGELWEKFSEQEDTYHGELVDFEVDYNLKNIFAA